MTYLLLIALWTLFGLFHTILAVPSVKVRFEAWGTKYRLLYSLFSTLLLLFILGWMAVQPKFWLWEPTVFSKAAGLILATFGLLALRKVVKEIPVKEFVGLKPEVLTPDLITDGMFGKVRHPIYTATFMIAWGYFLFAPSDLNLVSVCSLTTYTLIGAKIEERKLLTFFGAPYAEYKQRTPMLIPKKLNFFSLLQK